MGKKKKPQDRVPINIDFDRMGIDMSSQYACCAKKRAVIQWTCHDPIGIKFDWNAPFEIIRELPNLIEMRIKDNAIPGHHYKYTVAAYHHNKVHILDPEVIVIPPRR